MHMIHAGPRRNESYALIHALPLLALPLLTACGMAPADGAGAWEAERLTVDGVEVVRTLSGSVWSGPAELVEELRIGVLEGADEYLFGRIDVIAPDGEGGVYVFDGLAPALRHYDAEGRYIRTLGGEGSGPGEYWNTGLGLAVLPDGRILLRDPRNARFNVYEPDGSPSDHWPVASGLFTSRATYVDTAGYMYARVLMGPIEPDRAWPIGLLRYSPAGEPLDTIFPPSVDREVPAAAWTFMPSLIWDLHPHGYPVIGVSDRYAIELRKPEGTLRIEKIAERVPVGPEERAEWETRREWMIRVQGQFMSAKPPPTPRVKPYFGGIYAGADGSVWVNLHRTAEHRPLTDPGSADPDAPPPNTWIEPTVFDIFDSDGTYLGELHAPPRTRVFIHSLDEVWAVERGEYDESYVLRMRVATPN